MSLITPSDFDEQNTLLLESLAFGGVLTQPETQQTPEGQLFTFYFDNGYGALVMRSHDHSAHASAEQRFDACLLDCSRRPFRPTFELELCPDIQSGLTHPAICTLLARAERLPRHPNMTHHDELLMEEDF